MDTEEGSERALIRDELIKLEQNKLSVFSCAPLLKKVLPAYLKYEYLRDYELLERMGNALTKSTRLTTLRWVLGWEELEEGMEEDLVAKFLSTSVNLHQVALDSPLRLPFTLASYLKAVSENHHIQRLELRTRYLPLPALCVSLAHLRVLHISHIKENPEGLLRFSMADLDIFCNSLAQNTALKELHLTSIYFASYSGVPRHSGKARKHPKNHSIRTLHINLCRFDPLHPQRLLNTFGALEQLEVEGNNPCLMSWLYQKYKSVSLTSFQHNHLVPCKEWLKQSVTKCPNLQSYAMKLPKFSERVQYVCYTPAPRFYGAMVKGLRSCRSLTSLTMQTLLDEEALQTLMPCVRNLSSLSLILDSDVPLFFAAHLASRECRFQTLQLVVDPQRCGWNATLPPFQNSYSTKIEGLFGALRKNQTLKKFDLILDDTGRVRPTDHHIESFSWPTQRLQRLKISQHNLPPQTCQSLLEYMIANVATATVSDLELGGLQLNVDGVLEELLGRYLRHPLCPLERLTLVAHYSPAEPLFEALADGNNTRLRSLLIGRHSDSISSALVYLPRIACLRCLKLEDDALDASVAFASEAFQTDVLRALRSNQSLWEFSLQGLPWNGDITYYGLRNRVNSLLAAVPPLPASVLPHLLAQLQTKEWCPSIVFHVLTNSCNDLSSSLSKSSPLTTNDIGDIEQDNTNQSSEKGKGNSLGSSREVVGVGCWTRLLCRRKRGND